MSFIWIIVLIIGALAFVGAFWALGEGLFQGRARCFAVAAFLIVVFVVSIMGVKHTEIISHEVTDLTVSHTDILSGKSTRYQLLLTSEDGQVVDKKVTKEEYATIHEGDKFPCEITWYRNNLGEEYAVVEFIEN